MNELIMIKYGELTTKKDNRKYFVKTLTENIEQMLKDEKAQIIKNNVRMYIYCENADKIEEKLKKVFGIHSISKAYKVNK